MKKVMVGIIALMLGSMCMAQEVVNINAVEKNNDGKYFIVLEDAQRREVSPLIYKIIEESPTSYCQVGIGDVQGFFNKKDLGTPNMRYVFEVKEVVLDENDVPKVIMTNGYAFSDPDLAWLTVLEGQHVQISRFVGLTRELTIFETVSRETPLTDVDAKSAAAPAKSQLAQMIEKVKAKAKKSAEL